MSNRKRQDEKRPTAPAAIDEAAVTARKTTAEDKGAEQTRPVPMNRAILYSASMYSCG